MLYRQNAREPSKVRRDSVWRRLGICVLVLIPPVSLFVLERQQHSFVDSVGLTALCVGGDVVVVGLLAVTMCGGFGQIEAYPQLGVTERVGRWSGRKLAVAIFWGPVTFGLTLGVGLAHIGWIALRSLYVWLRYGRVG